VQENSHKDRMSNRWFDSSRQIFWDNNQQDLSIPGSVNAQSATFDSVYAPELYPQIAGASIGANLTPVPSITPGDDWRSVAMSASGQYQSAAPYGSDLKISRDYGATWQNAFIGNFKKISVSASGQYQTAVQDSAAIHISSDYGATWISRNISTTYESVCISASGQYQTAVVDNGLVYVSSDYGNTWTSKLTSQTWRDVAMSASGQYQTAIGIDASAYRSNNYGVSWSPVTVSAGVTSYLRISMSATGQYQAVVNNGVTDNIHLSNDYGITWATTGLTLSWNNIVVSASGQYMIAYEVDSSHLWISTDYGVTWNTNYVAITNLSGMALSASGNYFTIVIQTDTIYTSTTPVILPNIQGSVFNISSLVGDIAQISSLTTSSFSTLIANIGSLNTSSIVINSIDNSTAQISSLTAVNMSSLQGQIGDLITSSIVSNNLSSLTGQISSLITLNISTVQETVNALTASSIVSNNVSSFTSQVSSLTTLNMSSLRAQVGGLTTSSIVSNNVSSFTSQISSLITLNISTVQGTVNALTASSIVSNNVSSFTGQISSLIANNVTSLTNQTSSITANSIAPISYYSWQTTTSNDNFNTGLTPLFNQQGSNFTLECYLYPTFLGTFNTVLSVNNGSIATGGKEFRIYYNGSNGFGAGYPSGTTTTGFTTGSAIALNAWYHLALVRNTTNITLYLNGSNWATATMFNYTTSENRQLQVFAPRDGVQTGQGYINSIRFTIGQALYTGTFTPPTQQLTTTTVGTSGANVAASITGSVALLGAVTNSFTDQGSNALPLTVAGSPIISLSTPTTFVSTLTFNGGVTFNGPGRISTFIVGSSNLPPVFSTNDHLFVNGFFDVYNTTSASTLIRMAGAFGTNYIQSGRASTASTFAPADIVFGSPGAVSEYVRFTSTGRVGIGTASPANTLDVIGTTSFNGYTRIGGSNAYYDDGAGRNLFAINTSNNANYGMQIASPSSFMQFVPNASASINLIRSASNTSGTLVGQDLGFQIGGTEVIRFTSTARVGIGTGTPAYTLDVTGTGRFVNEGEALRVQATQNSNSLFTTFQKATVTSYVGWFGFGLQGLAYSNYFGMQGSVSTSLAFYTGTTSGGSPSLFLGSNSRVGILTDTPAYTLDVNGTTRLKDTLLSGTLTIPSTTTANSSRIDFPATNYSIVCGVSTLGGTNQVANKCQIMTYTGAAVISAFTVGTDRTKLIGINNCNDPQYTLDVNGSTHQSNNLTTWGVTSDRRIKTNIEFANLDICYSSIQALTLRRYEYDSNVFPNREDKHVIGLVAQEVQPIFPKAVTQTSSFGFSDLLGIDYDQLYMANLGATKKLMDVIEQQGSTIQGMQQQLSTLQKS